MLALAASSSLGGQETLTRLKPIDCSLNQAHRQCMIDLVRDFFNVATDFADERLNLHEVMPGSAHRWVPSRVFANLCKHWHLRHPASNPDNDEWLNFSFADFGPPLCISADLALYQPLCWLAVPCNQDPQWYPSVVYDRLVNIPCPG